MAKFLRKAKVCKMCGKEFLPYTTTQPVCSVDCLMQYNSEKEVKKRVKELKKGLLTHSDYLSALQIVFNKYIRLRDKDKGCICCGRRLEGIYDAGHFYSVGAYPNLRFDEDNVHGQTRHCNSFLHGNLLEYQKGLINRIGIKAFKELEKRKNEHLKLTIPEIKTLIEKYKQLCKQQ